MKCFEHIILHQLMKHKKPYSDPYQFAYKHNRSTKDKTLLYNAYILILKKRVHLSKFCLSTFPLPSALQAHLMTSKLLKLDVNPRLILWIVDFFVNRSQTVHHQAALSSSCSISTGSPQGTVLSILFTVYTNDCTGTDTTPVIKYSDDSAIEIYPTQIVFILL